MATETLPHPIRVYSLNENITAEAAKRMLAHWRGMSAEERARCYRVTGVSHTLERATAVERREAEAKKTEPKGLDRVVAAFKAQAEKGRVKAAAVGANVRGVRPRGS